MTTSVPAWPAGSAVVATLNVLLEYVPAAGLETLATVTVAFVFFGSAQVPPLLASVIVATFPDLVLVAEQLVNPVVRPIAGVVEVNEKAGLKVTVIVLPAMSAPLPLVW